jgi:hypothetical protein
MKTEREAAFAFKLAREATGFTKATYKKGPGSRRRRIGYRRCVAPSRRERRSKTEPCPGPRRPSAGNENTTFSCEDSKSFYLRSPDVM